MYIVLDYYIIRNGIIWGPKTNQGYSIEIKYTLEATKQLNLHNKVITEFKKAHFKTILEQVRQNRSLSPKGYNKYRGR